ncbi:MAG: clan AA aspartic protease (TIGR02281 family) [Candidatus Endobugula sp.]|jgi:clan AA aspartic protease (TIGR02281 family)
MKWITYLICITVCLVAGYWLGAERSIYGAPSTASSTLPPTPENEPIPTIASTKSTLPRPTTTEAIKPLRSPTGRSLTGTFLFHLTMRNYDEAASILYDTGKGSTEHTSMKEGYTTHILSLLKEPHKYSADISNALTAYLANFYDDTEVLLLQASYHVSLSEYGKAINALQQAKSYAYNTEQANNIIQMYNEVILYIDIQLSQEKEWRRLTDIYLHAEHADLLQEADIFRLAELYLLQDETYLAEGYLALLSEKTEWLDKISALSPKQTETSDINNKTISLKKIANQFIITTQLSGHTTHLLIDTGASLTTITKDYYEKIRRSSKFSYVQEQVFLTANGKTIGEIYKVDSMGIGSYRLENIEIAVLDFPASEHSSGLLGMNILQHFKFEIDQKKSQLILQKTSQQEHVP